MEITETGRQKTLLLREVLVRQVVAIVLSGWRKGGNGMWDVVAMEIWVTRLDAIGSI